MTTVTQRDIVTGLRSLGLHSGCKLLAHSSLSSFGHVEGGADAVIDALLECVAPSGTVLVPTLTGNEHLSPDNPPVFDPICTPCWTGRIPETFRQRPDAIRSFHPTHSVAAIGPDAVALTCDHRDSIMPCDETSPYGKLAELDDSYIALLGVAHECNTTFHHVEEIAGVSYHMQPLPVRAVIVVDGREIVRHIMIAKYGTPRHFGIMEPLLEERGIQTRTRIGDAEVRLINVRRMVHVTLQALRANERLLCR